MITPPRVFAVLVVAVTVFSLVQTNAQAQPGRVIVSSDLELLSLGSVDGGGRVTWTLQGDEARELREKVVWMFDAQLNIPRGFRFGSDPTGMRRTGATTSTMNNGLIDTEEGTTYLAYLENQLETLTSTYRAGLGTEFRFVFITRADRAAQDLPAERSTSGLVDTGASATENLEIRFIFNAQTTDPQRRFPQADRALVDALHQVFGFDTGLEDLTPSSNCPPRCYPFPATNGWRVVTNATLGPFLWHGNVGASPWNTTGAYPNAATNVTYYAESISNLTMMPIDLRFAVSASFSFEHTGGAAPDDNLTVQVSPDAMSWTTLLATNDGDGDPAIDSLPLGTIGNSTFDLDAYVGTRVYLRLNFTANGDGLQDGPGYYLRNLRIIAPSVYTGTIDFRHTDYVVGFLSFSGFRSQVSRPTLVRTPVGEVMWYSAVYDVDAMPLNDTAQFATFDFLENPQILFVLLVIAAWLIGLFQDKSWERYRMRHPADLRATAVKVKWLHWIGRIVIILLIVFYFLPTLLGADLTVGGLAYWIFAVASIGGVTGFTIFWYDRRAKMIPKEPVVTTGERLAGEVPPPPPPPGPEVEARVICAHCDADIEDPAMVYKCACGQVYHVEHAAALGTCPNCARTLQVAPPPEKRLVTVKCPWCDEINVLEEEVDLAYTKCTACGIVLKEVARGYNYLIVADEPHIAYEWFRSVAKQGAPGLAMSTTFPEKLRREYGLPDGVELYWVSDTNPGPRTLDPKRLDFEIMRALSNFVKGNKGGALVLDGLEYLVVENSFDRVLKFIKKVNDLASVHDATMFVPVTPTGLGPEEMTLLRKEFDKVETIGAARA